MAEIWVPIIVALIMGPLVVLISKLRRENTEQHAEARAFLRLIGRKVDKIGEKIDGHLGWHDGKKDK